MSKTIEKIKSLQKAKTFDPTQKKRLLSLAKDTILEFERCVVRDGQLRHPKDAEFGFSIFEDYFAFYTQDFLTTRQKFTTLAATMLKAKSAHEKTIRTLCQKAGQAYVKRLTSSDHVVLAALEDTAKQLVETVLAEAGKEYVHLVPNFLVKHAGPEIVRVGRVRFMRTELVALNTDLHKNKGLQLAVDDGLEMSLGSEIVTVNMPECAWVVEVPSTKENVSEEAKWLIDVASSLMRLCTNDWQGNVPSLGELERHPFLKPINAQPYVTLEGGNANTSFAKKAGWYETNKEVLKELQTANFQTMANLLFDPSEKSLAQRVAQGLGWMARGRQVADRAERLLSFFTALESLLAPEKNDPVTQTISRHASVIYAQEPKKRVIVYNQIKGLYALRSKVVHEGRREVLWQEVNDLQKYVETIFWIVLKRCDLSMEQVRFSQSLSDASHGLPWEFAAAPIVDNKTE